MKNTEKYDISRLPSLNAVSSYIKDTTVLCEVLMKLVGDFEDKFDKRLSLITFGPKTLTIGGVNERNYSRNIKIRWAETEEKIIQTKVVE